MKIEHAEILFIRKNAPKGFYTLVADNIRESRTKVKNELNLLKEDYDEKIIIESRRLLKVIKGLEYNQNLLAA